ncbi:hypothetical protein ABKV19_023441 [Rosa sericea]
MMWGTIANLKENLNKIAQDVHDDSDEEEFEIYASTNGGGGQGSSISDRRNSHSFAHSNSPSSRSPVSNGGVGSGVSPEVNGKVSRSYGFPSAARKMDTLNDLLAASDLISLHCALTNETIQILNAECLQHVKAGAFLVNTAGCALDGAEGPQWMEAWVKEMPNVLILPHSADYSEEVWLEIREKAISVLQTLFFDGVVPKNVVSDEDKEDSEIGDENEH